MLVAVSWSRSAQTNLTEASQLLLYIYTTVMFHKVWQWKLFSSAEISESSTKETHTALQSNLIFFMLWNVDFLSLSSKTSCL